MGRDRDLEAETRGADKVQSHRGLMLRAEPPWRGLQIRQCGSSRSRHPVSQ